MKLAALRALVIAIEEGSLRAAARRLQVSQPALTKMMRELEMELAAPLLIRQSNGVLPTAQGKVLVEHAARIGNELSSATDLIAQLGGQMRGEINVGAVPLAVMLLIPETLRTYSKAFPEIRLRVSEELYIAQLQGVRSGAVDIAVGGIPDSLASGELAVEQLMHTRMVVVVRKGNPHARARSLAQLAGAKWVFTAAAGDTGYAVQLFEKNGLPRPELGAVVNSTLTLVSLLANGDYVGLMPVQIAEHPIVAPYLVTVPIEERGLDLTIGAITRKDTLISPAVRHFIAHLHRAAHQLSKAAKK